jgi:hypothetical protein
MSDDWRPLGYWKDKDGRQKVILGQSPGDVHLLNEGRERGVAFRRFMAERGFRVERYQYKVMTSWIDSM